MSERAPTFLWSGRPVYRCRFEPCSFERMENLEAVLEHEASAHAPAGPTVRESSILGPDEKPVLVEEGLADFGDRGTPVLLHGQEPVVPKSAESKKQSRRRRK